MANRKVLTELLGIKYPILLSPMAGVSTPELAAIVSNEGGLGSLGLGASPVEKSREAIFKTQLLTDKPFQVNFFCHEQEPLNKTAANGWTSFMEPIFGKFGATPKKELKKIYKSFLEEPKMLELVLDTKPKAVSFHFGVPSKEIIQELKRANIVTMATVTQISEANVARQAGIDILVAQGVEAGGHRGMFNPSVDPGILTKDLVMLLVSKIGDPYGIPIVAAGGIMRGRDIKEMYRLGADGCQLGTAFIQCKESGASEAYREALFKPKIITQITDSISGRPARAIFNSWHSEVDIPSRPQRPCYPNAYDLGKQLHSVSSSVENSNTNNPSSFGIHWAGSNVIKSRRLDASKLFQTLVQEIDE
ncbi:probable 2-nitropropane dioxygenase [Kluyveromyces marxianus DMKU3-1042]|uniref:Probable 2-nitropropane dioxygenase n=1 Tax=Kluyveromyces marxianus (strain DMKU3-1042 / BCC 29191 / NBRC 104275) TaxID=1003335 RepID=W0TCS7_KLUMD|nr:probable 2-nitropropane dioxygenase [Kluyveromyces marxianus DMKU3-1042]BAO39899.1 probable 2-nitropropane dioxygenase [Kluyveromyces marxianus DMKU3-1042]